MSLILFKPLTPSPLPKHHYFGPGHPISYLGYCNGFLTGLRLISTYSPHCLSLDRYIKNANLILLKTLPRLRLVFKVKPKFLTWPRRPFACLLTSPSCCHTSYTVSMTVHLFPQNAHPPSCLYALYGLLLLPRTYPFFKDLVSSILGSFCDPLLIFHMFRFCLLCFPQYLGYFTYA